MKNQVQYIISNLETQLCLLLQMQCLSLSILFDEYKLLNQRNFQCVPYIESYPNRAETIGAKDNKQTVTVSRMPEQQFLSTHPAHVSTTATQRSISSPTHTTNLIQR